MKKLVALYVLTAMASGALATELVIGKGETYTVTEDQVSLSVDRLVIGDNARIQFAEGVAHWELLARDATIGHGVVIDGRGSDGAPGNDGADHSDQAESCRSGKSGQSGESGASGNRGVDIYLGLDANRIGSLEVLADGGAGGDGGQGGQGQKAGRILNCAAANGGTGGSGGQGGDGGDGGNVVVSVSSLGEVHSGALTAGVRVSVRPGKAGAAGSGGHGGEGTDGQYVTQKTLTGTQKWLAGGRSGRSGVPGEPGDEGRHGRAFVGGQFTGFESSAINQGGHGGFGGFRSVQPASEQLVREQLVSEQLAKEKQQAAEQEVQMLREQLKALQERMEKLEKQ